jgi:hypothetical protein
VESPLGSQTADANKGYVIRRIFIVIPILGVHGPLTRLPEAFSSQFLYLHAEIKRTYNRQPIFTVAGFLGIPEMPLLTMSVTQKDDAGIC